MSDPQRAEGRMLPLPQGATFVRWQGPARGPVAVLVPGLSAPSAIWGSLAPSLVRLGFRVLSYDLYGRGRSATVSGRQDGAFFCRQLEAVFAAEGLTDDVTLIGYAMGGAIVAAYAAEHAHQLRQIVLIAPAGMTPPQEDGLARFIRRTPVLGDLMHAVVTPRRLRTEIETLAQTPSEVPDLGAARLAELGRRGFLAAVLASQRGILTESMETAHRAIGRADIPVFAFWGEEDKVIPLRGLGVLATWNRNARQESIPEAGHGLPHTHGRHIAARLASFWAEE